MVARSRQRNSANRFQNWNCPDFHPGSFCIVSSKTESELLIVVENLHKNFGGIRAVDNASLTIKTGSITGLIGPNGAGKTTLFNVIAGHYRPTSGRVLLDGKDITGLSPHELFAQGVLRTFQIAHEFSTLTVRENLMMVPPGQSGETLSSKPGHNQARCAAKKKYRAKAMKSSSSWKFHTWPMNWRAICQADRKNCWSLAAP
jgi:ABC-type branched-subunit amino acid transport system ATPase component